MDEMKRTITYGGRTYVLRLDRLTMDEAAFFLARFTLKERSASFRRFRRKHDFTLAEAALLAGFNKSTLSRYEKGTLDLKVESMYQVLQLIFDVDSARENIEKYVAGCDKLRKKKPDFDKVIGPDFAPPPEIKARNTWICDAVKRQVLSRRQTEPHQALMQDLQKEISSLKARIERLTDLLGLETKLALTRAECEEVRRRVIEEKI